MTSKTLSRISMRLKMTHETGDVLYPVKMKNTKTGKVAFRVSEEGNKVEDCIEIEDEQIMLDYVVKKGFSVRARTLPTSTKRDGLYGINKRKIVSYRLD
jgi:hypothetical protein